MPHDRKGVKVKEGDLVRIPVREMRTLLVEPNPEAPGEYTPSIQVFPEASEQTFLTGKVGEIYEGEEACNAVFQIDGAPTPLSFNTRLVEKIAG
jgi:hypothetical protein